MDGKHQLEVSAADGKYDYHKILHRNPRKADKRVGVETVY
jgi:hypothetical protein